MIIKRNLLLYPFIFLTLFLISNTVFGGDPSGKELYGRVHGGLAVEGGGSIEGEKLDLRKGSLSWETLDVAIPGDAGLDIEVYRSFQGGERIERPLEDWAISLPRITMSTNPGGRTWHDVHNPPTDDHPGICSTKDGLQNGNIVYSNLVFLLSFLDYLNDSGVDMPYISILVYLSSIMIGSAIDPKDSFSGLFLTIPGEGAKSLLRNLDETTLIDIPLRFSEGKASGARYVTVDNWVVDCLSDSTGTENHFKATSPTGKVYKFDQLSKSMGDPVLLRQTGQHIWYPSEVTDKFGNWLKYSYLKDKYLCIGIDTYLAAKLGWTKTKQLLPVCPVSHKIQKISSNDGRRVDFIYETPSDLDLLTDQYLHGSRRISSIKANDQEWTYSYEKYADGYSNYLKRVDFPDGKYWEYEKHPKDMGMVPFGANDWARHMMYTRLNGARILSADPLFGIINRGNGLLSTVTTPLGAILSYDYEKNISSFFEDNTSAKNIIHSIVERKITGPDINEQIWSYDYTKDGAVSEGYTTLTMPNTSDGKSAKKKITFDLNGNSSHFGVPVKTELFSDDAVIRSEETQYIGLAVIGDLDAIKERPVSVNTLRAVKKKIINLDEKTYTTDFSDFDKFGNPQTITETGENYVDHETKLEVTPVLSYSVTYFNNEEDWIIGLQKKVNITNFDNGTFETAQNYYSNGNVKSTTVNGIKKEYTYWDNGNLKEEIWYQDGIRYTKRYESYKCGIAQKELHPDGVEINKFVNDSCKIEWEEDGNNNRITYIHDTTGNVTDEIYLYFDNKHTDWIVAGNPRKSQVTESKKKITITLDALGNTIEEKREDLYTGISVYSRKQFDAYGKEIKTFNLSHNPNETLSSTASFDILGRAVSAVNQAGVEKSFCYSQACLPSSLSAFNHSGRIVNITTLKVPSEGDVSNSVTNDIVNVSESVGFGSPDKPLLIDTFNSVSETESLKYRWTHYKHLISGDVKEISFGGLYPDQRIKRIHKFFPNTTMLKSVNREDLGIVEYTYYENGQIKTVKNNNREPITYIRDGHGREIYIDANNSDGSPDVSFGYDYNGNVKWADNGYARWDYYYNGINETESAVFSLAGNVFSFDYEWLPNKNMLSMEYPNGEVTFFDYDGMGRMTRISDYATEIKYLPTEDVKSFQYGNGYHYEADVNDLSKMGYIKVTDANGIGLVDEIYNYNFMSHIYQKKSKIGKLSTQHTNTYQYNPNGFIRSGSSYGLPISYKYDAIGNISQKSEDNHIVDIQYRNYNDTATVGMLVKKATSSQLGVRSYSYDDLGNVTSNGLNDFIFNGTNSLLRVDDLDIDYTYDANGFRAAVESPGESVITIRNNNGNTLVKYDLTKSEVTNYVYLANSLLAANKESCNDCPVLTDMDPRTTDVDRLDNDFADLSVSLLDGKLEGKNYVFTISIINGGPIVAKEAVFSQVMPDGVTIIDWNVTKGDCTVYDENDVTCELGDLVSQEEVLFTATMGDLTRDDLYKSATSIVFSSVYDPDMTNNIITEAASGGGTVCPLMASAYDTIGTEHLASIRMFRDDVLMENNYGRKFVAAYYKTAPEITTLYYENEYIAGVIQFGFYSALAISIFYSSMVVKIIALIVVMLLLSIRFMKSRSKLFAGLALALVSTQGNAGVVYFHHDNIQSVVAVTDDAGGVVWTKKYTPFGEENHSGGNIEKEQGFGGHEKDYDTSLVYMKARYYDVLAGRFMTVDPSDISENSSASINSYQYSANSPIGLRDPDGNEVSTAEVAVYGVGPTHVAVFARPDFSWELATYRPDIFRELQIHGGTLIFDAVSKVTDGTGYLIPRALSSRPNAAYRMSFKNEVVQTPVFESLTYQWSADSESIMRMYDTYQTHIRLAETNPVLYNGLGSERTMYWMYGATLTPFEVDSGLFMSGGWNSNNTATWYMQAGGLDPSSYNYGWAPGYGTSLEPYTYEMGGFGGSDDYTGYDYGGYSY